LRYLRIVFIQEGQHTDAFPLIYRGMKDPTGLASATGIAPHENYGHQLTGTASFEQRSKYTIGTELLELATTLRYQILYKLGLISIMRCRVVAAAIRSRRKYPSRWYALRRPPIRLWYMVRPGQLREF